MKRFLPCIFFLLLCGTTYAQETEPVSVDQSQVLLDSNINPDLELLNNRKLDLRPRDVLPVETSRYVLGDSNYKWKGIFADSVTLTNLYGLTSLSISTLTASHVDAASISGSTLTFSSATITQLSVSSLTLTNLNSLFKLAVGTFTSSGSTGNQSITGVGFRPRFIALAMGAGGADTTGYTAFGWATATKQAAAFGFRSDDSNSGGLGTNATTVIRWSDTAGNAVGQASLASMDTDGFTLNWTAANAQVVTYFAVQ